MNVQDHGVFNQKMVKVYFVELDDDNRERVISGVVANVTFETKNDYEDICSEDGLIYRAALPVEVEMNAIFVEQDGVLFKHEIWDKEDEDDE